MRERLEVADNSLSNLESSASVVEVRLHDIQVVLTKIETLILQLHERGDAEIVSSLQINLSQKQIEFEQQEEARNQIATQLNEVGSEIKQLQTQNNRSREEVTQLEALGEDVGVSVALTQERQKVLQTLEQRYEELLARLYQPVSLRISEALRESKIRGFFDVPVADLPDPEGVGSPADFDHHITWENAKSAALLLPQIQQEIANGKTGDDFAMEDLAAGLDWQNGKKRVYDLFYSNNEPIRLEKGGNGYSITSGRHRIYAAKAVGLHTIPAKVVETS